MARLQEESEFTSGGMMAAASMAFVAVVMVLAFVGDGSAVRQAAYGAAGTALIVLFGACAIIGRRRTYVVYREPEQS